MLRLQALIKSGFCIKGFVWGKQSIVPSTQINVLHFEHSLAKRRMGSEGRKDASHPGSESLLLHGQFLMNPKQRNEGKCEYLCRKSSFDGAGPASLFLLLDHAV